MTSSPAIPKFSPVARARRSHRCGAQRVWALHLSFAAWAGLAACGDAQETVANSTPNIADPVNATPTPLASNLAGELASNLASQTASELLRPPSTAARLQRSAASTAQCEDGLPRGERGEASPELTTWARFTPSPADVTVCPNGDAFLTLDGPDEIWRVPPPPAEPQRYASVRGVQPAGIACDERGRLFVAGFAVRAQSSYAAPTLLLVDEEQQALALPQPRFSSFATPNGVAFVPGCGIFTSDTLGGLLVRTYETRPGRFQSEVQARGLLGINGIAYDPNKRRLYVSNSLTQEVVYYAVDDRCRLARRFKPYWSGNTFGAFLDGLAVDALGDVYVASYTPGPVLHLPDGESVATLDNPASLAFRGGTLLMVDYHLNQPALEGGLFAVALGRCGADLFAAAR